MRFEIKNRWSGEVIYGCELSAEVAGQPVTAGVACAGGDA